MSKKREEIIEDIYKLKEKALQNEAIKEIEKEIANLELKVKIAKERINNVEKKAIISEANKELAKKYGWGVDLE